MSHEPSSPFPTFRSRPFVLERREVRSRLIANAFSFGSYLLRSNSFSFGVLFFLEYLFNNPAVPSPGTSDYFTTTYFCGIHTLSDKPHKILWL